MIKKHGGIFGRNPTFNNVTVDGSLAINGPITINGDVFSGLDYDGTWNASTNTPTLTSSVGTIGHFYIVSIAGSTNLDGITNWGVGDWAVFNGSVWQRVEGGADGNFADLSVTGTAEFADGLAASPSITNIGDTNTGLYFPSADAIAIVTGGVNRLRVTSAGDIGIGTTSPGAKLEVAGNVNITGNTTLGDASTDTVTVNGYMGVGGAPTANIGLQIFSSALTGAGPIGIASTPVGPATATTTVRAVYGRADTAAASFTVADVMQFQAANSTKGAGSTITSQHGLYISDQTQGTNNYGITSLVSSGTNKWNIYASGTAANYFAGKALVGTTTDQDGRLIIRSTGNTYANSAVAIVDSANTTKLQMLQTTSGFFYMTVNGTDDFVLKTTETVFNESGADIDFRVESDTDTHALFVEGSSGNVGIGTSSPGAKLEVSSTGTSISRFIGTQGGTLTTYFQNPATFANSQAYTLDFEYTDGAAIYTAARIKTFRTGGSKETYLSFETTPTAGVVTERMRLDSSGNLGLGVTPSAWSTGRAFEFGAVGNALWGYSGNTILSQNTAGYSGSFFYATTAAASRYQQNAGSHAWYTAPSGTAGNAISFTQDMTLDSTGLGVGTTSPDIFGRFYTRSIGFSSSGTTALQINGTTYGTIDLGAGGTRTTSLTGSGTEAQFATVTSIPLIFSTNNTERMRITSAGDVGVGTSSPTYKVDIQVSSGSDQNILLAGATGASNGFHVRWISATSKTHVIISDIPTSSSGLAAGTLWNDGGTIKIA